MTTTTERTGQQLVEDAIVDLVVEEQRLKWELVTVAGGDNRVLQKAHPGGVLVGEARHELNMAFDEAMDGLFGSEIQRGELVDRVLGGLANVWGKLEALRTVGRAAVDAVDAERRATRREVAALRSLYRDAVTKHGETLRKVERLELEVGRLTCEALRYGS